MRMKMTQEGPILFFGFGAGSVALNRPPIHFDGGEQLTTKDCRTSPLDDRPMI